MDYRKIRRRSQFIGAIVLLLFFAVVYRLYTLQVVEASWYQERSSKVYHQEENLRAKRGTIFDRNHHVLAQEVEAYTVVAILDPEQQNHVKDPQKTAEQLAPHLNMTEEELYELLTKKDVNQVELRPGGWKVDREVKEAIEALQLEGITFIETNKRHYPHGAFASYVLGFVDRDGVAKMGLELELNDYLTGKEGTYRYSQDRRGNRLLNSDTVLEPPQHGFDVYLTIDHRIQRYLEEAMDEVYREYQPEKMVAIVSNPHTGEILAMASRPNFDPNQYSAITNYYNDAVSYAFEPGSTFKIVTFSAAIEEGVYRDQQTFQSGSYSVGKHTIRDHRRGGWGTITMREGFEKSSNVAAVILGYERLDKNVFYHYIDRFGFGKLTEIDLPGETEGIIKPLDQAKPIDVATMTFGQGLTVTPIQQIQAINVLANGGKLLKPYIIDAIHDPNQNKTVVDNEPEVVDPEVVSPETAQKMKDLLESVVTDGTGVNFYLEGYHVAGKTGTAQKPKEGGGYHPDKYIHSFLGFAPKDDPQLSMFVAVDAPQVEHSYLGGTAVAQVFKPVMEQSLHYLNVSQDIETVVVQEKMEEKVEVDNYIGLEVSEAASRAEEKGFTVHIEGQGNVITRQVPSPGQALLAGSKVYLLSGDLRYITMPNLSGWSLKEVQEWAQVVGLNLSINGHGYVVEQEVPQGELIRPGTTLKLELKPLIDH